MTNFNQILAAFLLAESPTWTIRTGQTRKQDPDSVNLNRTKTSQQARAIEDQLAKDMEKLYKTIMADPSKDFAVLQKKYGPQSEALIRTAVQKIYLLGADYATKTQDTTAFITQQDLANVKKQVDVTYVAFWKRVYDEVHRKDIIIPTEPEEAKPVDPAVEAALISTVTATTTLALSTLSKLDQLGGDAQTKKLVWITEQDDRVCQICQPLHGQEFEQDDPTMPIPGPDSTHFRCRCRLLVKEGDDILL